MELKGKVALVTGAGRGIGRAIAIALARKGANVGVNYAHSGEEAKEVVELCRSYGVDAIALKADVRDRGEVWEIPPTLGHRFSSGYI